MFSISEETSNNISIKFKKTKDFNEILINTLRRLTLSEVYSWAFPPENIQIQKNTGILNNDNIRHRISLLPIQTIKESSVKGVTISMVLNEKNTDSQVKTITTDHCVVRVNNIIRKGMFPSPPVIICNLKEDDVIELNATASYGKAYDHNMYAAAANSYFDEDDTSYTLYIESLGQQSCKGIFNTSCEAYIAKLTKLQAQINEHPDCEGNFIEIKIENENHTLGCLFVHELQQLKETQYAAYKLEHPSINNLIISITSDGSKNIKQLTGKVFKKLQDTFDKLKM